MTAGKQDAPEVGSAAVKHLTQGDPELLGFILDTWMPLRHFFQLGDGLFQAREPAGSGSRGTVDQEVELFDGVGPGPGGDDYAVSHRPCFRSRICRSSAMTSSAGLILPAFMSSIETFTASIRSARSASSISFLIRRGILHHRLGFAVDSQDHGVTGFFRPAEELGHVPLEIRE